MELTATVAQNEKKELKFSSLSGPDVEILLFGRQTKVPSKQTECNEALWVWSSYEGTPHD